MEQSIIYVVGIALTPQEMYVLENGIELLEQLSFYQDHISPTLWSLYPTLMDITVGSEKDEAAKKNVKKNGSWAYEIVRDVSVIFQNFIIKDTDTLLGSKSSTGCTYLEMTLHYISRLFEIAGSHSTEFDRVPAVRLIIALLEGAKGKIDDIFHRIVETVMQEMKKAQIDNYKCVLCQAMTMCFYYSVEQTFICLEAQGVTAAIIKEVFKQEDNLPTDHVRRMIYAAVALLSEPTKLPATLQKGLGEIFIVLARLCATMLDEPSEDSGDEIDMKKPGKKGDDEDDEDDDFGLGDCRKALLNDHPFYASPLKKVHVLYFVKGSLEAIAAKDMSYYKLLETALADKDKRKLIKAMGKAEELQSELLQQQQQQK